MKNQAIRRATLSHPKDQSLNAYKAWITEIAGRLTTEKESIQLTETQWTAHWRDFWKEKTGEAK